MKEYKSVCPYDCPDACGLILIVDENKVTKVRGNKEHAFTRGTLCPKMAHYERVIHSPKRLMTPLRRIGKKRYWSRSIYTHFMGRGLRANCRKF